MARNKRGHGEGSIYQRKDGRWVASITLEDHKRRTFYGKTRKEVQEKLKAALHEQQQGTLATGPQQSLKTYLDKWVEQVYRPRVKASSYQHAITIIRGHLVPAFGHIAVQKLTAERVQEVYTQKLKEGFSPRTILSIHSILRQALENAVRWNLVSRNVAKLVTLPRPERYEAKVLTVEQAKRLLEVAQGSGLETLLLMAVTTGMRRGELLGLHWDDIDFEHKVVHVQRTISRITGQGVKETEPKTRSSKRKIIVPDEVLVSLNVHRERQERNRVKAGVKWREHGLVFCSKQGDYMVEHWYTYEVFHKLLAKAGLPRMRFHDLRHSMATILLAANVHPKVVQERLGHSNMAVTMDVYSHVLPPIQQDAARKLGEMFQDE